MTFKWDPDRGLSYNGVYRASTDDLKVWITKEKGASPRGEILRNHATNSGGCNKRAWWQAQLALYGLPFEPLTTSRTARRRLRLQFGRADNLTVAADVADMERQLREAYEARVNQTSPPSRSPVGRPILPRRQPETIPRTPLGSRTLPHRQAEAPLSSESTLKRSSYPLSEPPAKRTRVEGGGAEHDAVSAPGTDTTQSVHHETTTQSPAASKTQHNSQSQLPAVSKPSVTNIDRPLNINVKVHLDQVKFLDVNDEDWIIEYQYNSTRYAVLDADDTYYHLIDNWRCQDLPQLGDGVFRASRWLDEDEPLSFYLAQLQFRDLKQTRRKEAAKWRLKTAARSADPSHLSAPLRNIFDQLEKILDSVMFDLSRGALNKDPRVMIRSLYDIPIALGTIIGEKRATTPRSCEDYSRKIGDVEEHVQEKPRMFRQGSPYDIVMARWIEIRRTLAPMKEQVLLDENTSHEPRLVSDQCLKCGKKLRACQCSYCGKCGELEEVCECNKCGVCKQGLDPTCGCVRCDRCEMKFDGPNGSLDNPLCFCRCKQCCRSTDTTEFDHCACNLSAADISARAQHQTEKRLQYLETVDRPDWSENFRNRMREWVATNRKNYYSLTPLSLHSKLPTLEAGALSGTYQIVSSFSPAMKSGERSELVLSDDGSSLYGRFSFGKDVHGLLRTGHVPAFASTEIVQCQWLVENFVNKDGSWLSPARINRSRWDTMTTFDWTNGIAFLGDGLLKISPQLFWHTTARIHGDVIFAVKVSNYSDNVEALKDSWNAIHSQMGEGGGQSGWREVNQEVDGSQAPWDEDALDRAVHRLSIDRSARTRKLTPA